MKEKNISATEVVRRFSDILSSVKYRKESFTIVRGGKPVARISPLASAAKEGRLGELISLLQRIPKLGGDADAFERDVETGRNEQPSPPRGDRWE